MGFLLYLFGIGIPKTQARNLYNQAMAALEKGDVGAARAALQNSVAAWPEDYSTAALAALSLIPEEK